MTHTIAISVLIFASFFLLWPISWKPLSEDDGNWYYSAIFWKRNVRLYTDISLHGYFGIQWFSTKLYNLIKTDNYAFFYKFKITWYSLTSVSIYWMTYCFWHNITLSLAAGLVFILVTAVPNTLFMLTYGEHFLILPINLCIIFTYYGFSTGNLLFFFLAGLASAWAFQIKPTALLFSILLPISFALNPKFLSIASIYYIAFIALNSLPFLFIKNKKGFEHKHYINGFMVPIFALIKICFNSLKAKVFNIFKPELSGHQKQELSGNVYIDNLHNTSYKSQWLNLKEFMLPASKDLYLILILAAVQIFYLFIKFDYFTLTILLLFIVYVLMQQAQKNYYTPHFNPCWAPISILAVKTIWDFWPHYSSNRALCWAMIAFISFGSYKIIKIIIKTFSKSEINTFGYLDPLFGKVYRLCEPIGKYIQENSNESDKLFVWGDQPSLYLYACREIFSMNHFLVYVHNNEIVDEKYLLDNLRRQPPELLIFYNYKVLDGWNIKRLQETIGIPYKHLKSFQITDDRRENEKNPQGICFDFPLYRRDDTKYKEILLDRALIAKKNEDANETRLQLENILEIFPEDYEASVRLSLLENDTNGLKATQSYLEEILAENHDSIKNAILLRLLAEIDTDSGNLDSAIENYDKALNLNPDDFRTYNGLGELCFSSGKIEEAFESFKKAIELHPYSSDVLNNIGVLLSQSGKRDDAIKYFHKALSIMPEHPDARKNIEALT